MFQIHWTHIAAILGIGAALIIGAVLFFLFVGFLIALVRGRQQQPAKAAPKPSTGSNSGSIDHEQLAEAVASKLRRDTPIAGALPSHPAVNAVVGVAQLNQATGAVLTQIGTLAESINKPASPA